MKLKGQLSGKAVIILIDSGSTHCFMDAQVVKELKLPVTKVNPVAVLVADERQLWGL